MPRQGVASASDELLAERLASLDPEAALALLKTVVAEEAATILRLPAGGIDPLRPLSEMGMDSLMAVELRLALEKPAAGRSAAGFACRGHQRRLDRRAARRGGARPRRGDGELSSRSLRVTRWSRACDPPVANRRSESRRSSDWTGPQPVRPVGAGKGAADRKAVLGIFVAVRGALAAPLRPEAGRTAARLDVSGTRRVPRDPHDPRSRGFSRHRRSVLSRA